MLWGQHGSGGLFDRYGLLPLGRILSWVTFCHSLWDLALNAGSWDCPSQHFIAFVFLSVKRGASHWFLPMCIIILSMQYIPVFSKLWSWLSSPPPSHFVTPCMDNLVAQEKENTHPRISWQNARKWVQLDHRRSDRKYTHIILPRYLHLILKLQDE